MRMATGGRLDGKIAMITGGAGGLGAAMARRFAAEGAKVLITDIKAERAAAIAEEIGCSSCDHDVTDLEGWHQALRFAEQSYGGLHVLVNNAGVGAAGSIENTSLDDWRQTHKIDLDSVFLGCKFSLPMIVQSCERDGIGGAILNISSIAGVIASGNMVAYNSAKAAVGHLSKSVALHCADRGYPVRCNSIHPAFIETAMLDSMVPDANRATMMRKLARQIPLGRIGEPDDVAWAAVYLCSDEARFVTATELHVDGGIAAQ